MTKYRFIKENLWNRLFHSDKVERQRRLMADIRRRIAIAPDFLDAISKSDSLMGLYAIHKDLWGTGFKNLNLGPDEYGMFRTKDISTMTPDEVFLGNIFGLWTFTISEWEEHKKDKDSYGKVLEQYRGILRSNVESLAKEYKEAIDNLKEPFNVMLS